MSAALKFQEMEMKISSQAETKTVTVFLTTVTTYEANAVNGCVLFTKYAEIIIGCLCLIKKHPINRSKNKENSIRRRS